MYGKSFFVLKDYVNHNSTYSPYDTYSPPMLSSVSNDKISTFFHFPRLVRHCQNNWLGYNCLESLINKANGNDFIAHHNYGKNTTSYIEAHIYSRILFSRDIKQICLSKEEFDTHPIVEQEKIKERIDEINSYLGYLFITFTKQTSKHNKRSL